MKIGEGEEKLSEESFSSPSPNPTPSSSKTFDCIESLLAGDCGRRYGAVWFFLLKRKGEEHYSSPLFLSN